MSGKVAYRFRYLIFDSNKSLYRNIYILKGLSSQNLWRGEDIRDITLFRGEEWKYLHEQNVETGESPVIPVFVGMTGLGLDNGLRSVHAGT